MGNGMGLTQSREVAMGQREGRGRKKMETGGEGKRKKGKKGEEKERGRG
jgi:hypothetical protein